jgi:hypothetical protein
MNEIVRIEDRLEIETPDGTLTFTREHAIELAIEEHNVKSAALGMGRALSNIRNKKLFYLRKCDSMEEYISQIQLGRANAYRYMQLADMVADRVNQENFLQAPATYLLDILKDAETAERVESGEIRLEKGRVIMPDGEEISYHVFVKRIREALREEVENDHKEIGKFKKQRDEAVKEKKELHHQLSESERTNAHQNVEIQRMRDSISALSNTHGVTEEMLKTWASRDMAKAKIADLVTQIEQGVTLVNNLHEDLMADQDIVGHVHILKTLLETAHTRIQHTYGPHFYNLHPSLVQENMEEPR